MDSSSSNHRDNAGIDVNLGPCVSADLQALYNDLDQARTLAADYRWQLAGKSNECAELRHLLEKSQRDLLRLQDDIGELRKERHRLASEVMKARAAELLAEENTALRKEVSQLKGALHALIKAVPNRSAEPKKTGEDPVNTGSNVIELDFGM